MAFCSDAALGQLLLCDRRRAENVSRAIHLDLSTPQVLNALPGETLTLLQLDPDQLASDRDVLRDMMNLLE